MSIRPEFRRALEILATMKSPVVIEIGAHKGDGVEAMLEANPASMIHAFEPDENNLLALRQRFSKTPNVRTVNAAVIGCGHYPRALHSFRGKHSRNSSLLRAPALGWHEHTEFVPVETLQHYCAAEGIAPDFIRFDCYGSEYDILRAHPPCVDNARMVLIAFHWKRGFCDTKTHHAVRKTTIRELSEIFKLEAHCPAKSHKHQHYLFVKEEQL